MRLTELFPQFVRAENDGQRHVYVDSLADAQGVVFDCPKCLGHCGRICVWFRDRGVPDEAEPKPARWAVSGTGLGDLTLVPSINCDVNGAKCHGSPAWHGHITGGVVTGA